MAQRDAALAKGNAIRIERGHIKRLLDKGEITLAEAMVSPAVASMQIDDLLSAQRRWGSVITNRFLKSLKPALSPTMRVQDITTRRLQEILATARPGNTVATLPPREVKRVDAEPFHEWIDTMLISNTRERLATTLQVNERRIRTVRSQAKVSLDLVDRWLYLANSGCTLPDLYPLD